MNNNNFTTFTAIHLCYSEVVYFRIMERNIENPVVFHNGSSACAQQRIDQSAESKHFLMKKLEGIPHDLFN